MSFGNRAAGAFQPQTLDIDERIFDRNLRIVDDDGDVGGLFGVKAAPKEDRPALKEAKRSLLPEPDLPSLQVTPDPGMCIKTRNAAGEKVFVNLCKVSQIPPAPPMTEARLREIVASEDYDSDYRVPMSLGSPREEKDKSGGPCLACDVAVNSAWYADNVEDSIVFTTFVVNVAMEGLCDKYGDRVNLDRQSWTILRNKKYLGKPQRHRIQQRAKGSKIEELDGGRDGDEGPKKKPLIAEIGKAELSEVQSTRRIQGAAAPPPSSNALAVPQAKKAQPAAQEERVPEYKIFKEPRDSDEPDKLVATLQLPEVRSARELTLDVGGDRLVVEARRAGYLLDVFLPAPLDPESCGAEFHRDRRVLTVTMPLAK